MREITLIHNHKTNKAIKKHQLLNEGAYTFLEELHILKIMANVGTIVVDPEVSRPANSVTIIIGSYTIYVLDVIDDEIEKLRIEKELQEVDKQIMKLEQQLVNEQFIMKAPIRIIEDTYERLNDLKQKQEILLELSETFK